MVIDFHTHAFPDQIAERAIAGLVQKSGGMFPPCSNGTLGGLVSNMDDFGVDISVVQPVITKASQLKTLNEWAKGIEGQRIISFGGIYPHTDDYKRDIDFVVSLGLKGLKFHPEYQDFLLDDEKMLPIYDYALNKGLILLFHAGFDPAFEAPYRSNPKAFKNISKKLGGGTIIAAHLGGGRQWDEVLEHLCGTDVYLDTSMGFKYYGKEQFLKILKAHGADKILFGSDSPWSRADEEIEIFNSLPITDEEKEKILSGNAKRLLNI
ncbi:MAG: amidohydrolase [Ruminococcaceae bacterium]|nr:amidohydrolase [Oscillospiraceae bacterium]